MIIFWVTLAWIGGIAAILGSLMTIASLLLWTIEGNWQGRLKVLGFSLGCAIVGFLLLRLIPFSVL
ncbi:hypothetical protein H6F51_20175 [Cyanobacteria bacterium FACHB-DQ100]|uniref:hypothetical protein n=1 Tax=unclassified Leptolyngbya TaxID=2650499 RepID=UPI0016808399|nr:hypothetical protein [Leptolyngbya sp. FACHB-17]MBD1824789.1 hypothetical protein [Cyanobacteria bacterium FACHB-DQ100]MBD2078934.1 hypothetical protein [Leptolyngbya sp. FACHB-17]